METRISPMPRDLRTGVAAVECAIIMPVLTLLVLGAVDVGQYAHVHQKVTEASRETARFAVRYDTTSVEQTKSMCADYLQEAFPGCSLETAAQVKMTAADGTSTVPNDLTTMPSGTQVNVQVLLQYDSVRWLNGFPILSGQTISVTTAMRRE